MGLSSDEALATTSATTPDLSEGSIQRLLRGLRRHLGLDVCFIGEVTGGKRILRFIEGSSEAFAMEVGRVDPADQSFCQRMLDGVIPNLVRDARTHPGTRSLPGTTHGGIGGYLGVPIVLPSGRVYGTLCAISHDPLHDLDDRDLGAVRMVADLVADQLARAIGPEIVDPLRVAARLDDPHGLSIVFQPVVDLTSRRTIGFEALSRFAGAKPEEVFREAWRTGIGEDLELKAVRTAVEVLPRLPQRVWMSVNVAPRTILSSRFWDTLEGTAPDRLVVEVTEHDTVSSYEEITRALESVLDRGVRLAIDDVGSGYSSLAHIVELSPDILKLDAVITRGVESELARRAMTNAFLWFARDIDAMLVVEGIETPQELRALRELGVAYGQGFHLGLPSPIDRLA